MNYKIVDNEIKLKTGKLELNNLAAIPESLVSKISSLSHLSSLSITNSNLVDLDFISNLPLLQTLILRSNNLVDISGIKSLDLLNYLDISNNLLQSIQFNFNYQKLEYIDVSFNRLDSLEFLNGNKSLTNIKSHANNISNVEFLNTLENLINLDISYNNISDLDSLKPNKNLRTIDLSGNLLKNIDNLNSLKIVESINLSSNKISSISSLARIKSLQSINVSKNQIKSLVDIQKLDLTYLNISFNPIHSLIEIEKLILDKVPVSISNKNGIIVEGCPLEVPPKEVLHKKDDLSVYRYFMELVKSGLSNINEAKIILAGNGEAGKTSLRYRLIDSERPLPKVDQRTKQVEIEDYTFEDKKSRKIFISHIWDFGGQQIIHHFHRLFMNQSCLYILVLETSKENEEIEYWLQTIKLYSKDSPILIVQNEKFGIPRRLDISKYKSIFNIKDNIYSINLLESKGIQEIRTSIEYHLQKLPHVTRKIPNSWLQIRTKLLQIRKVGEPKISFERFVEICQNIGNIYSIKAVEDIGVFLHNLGIILWYKDNPTLSNQLILEKHWATEGIFKIIFDERVNKSGYFTTQIAKHIWSKYEEYRYSILNMLELMMEFNLCLKTKGDQNKFFVPALLTTEPKLIEWQYPIQLISYYHYTTILPTGIINLLTAELYSFVQDDNDIWSLGFWIFDSNAQARLEVNKYTAKIEIKLAGPKYRELLGVIIKAFKDIHKTFENIKANLLIPCSCIACNSNPENEMFFFSYDMLIRVKSSNSITELLCMKSLEKVSISSLIESINPESGKFKIYKKMNVFISYSHRDTSFKTELMNRLKPIIRRNKEIGVWTDHQIKAGEDWSLEIEKNLINSDLIILLISDDFYSSDFINQKELPIIIDQHEKNEATVIPIIVRTNSHWKEFELSRIQAIPTEIETGKLLPISKWKDKDDAWSTVISKIRDVL